MDLPEIALEQFRLEIKRRQLTAEDLAHAAPEMTARLEATLRARGDKLQGPAVRLTGAEVRRVYMDPLRLCPARHEEAGE